MVFIAFVLFTVSTLAVHGKEVSTVGPVPRGCEGNTFCNIKPADYPQKDIDQLLESNPDLLKRMKRQAALAGGSNFCLNSDDHKLQEADEDGNCKTNITCYKPFQLGSMSLSHVIVQSKFFEQTIRRVTCLAPEKPCFQVFRVAAKCEQKSASITLYVYDTKEKKVIPTPSQIDVDCACVKLVQAMN